MKRLYFIVNPRSGQGQIKRRLGDVLDIFIKAGYEVTVHITQAPRDAVTRAACAAQDGYDLIVCSGGDGTLNEVVSGVMNSGRDVPIGYLPAGSTNDFSRSLQIPLETSQAALLAVRGTPHRLDVGMLGDRRFIYVAAFGAFTELTYQTPQDMKNSLGYLAYVMEGVRTIGSIRPHHVRIETDDAAFEGDYIVGLVTNSISVGGVPIPAIQDSHLDDGLLEVLLVKNPENVFDFTVAVSDLITGNTVNTEAVTFFKTHRLTVSCDEEISWTVDGEGGGAWRDVTIENIPRAVSIMTHRRLSNLRGDRAAELPEREN